MRTKDRINNLGIQLGHALEETETLARELRKAQRRIEQLERELHEATAVRRAQDHLDYLKKHQPTAENLDEYLDTDTEPEQPFDLNRWAREMKQAHPDNKFSWTD